MTGTRRDQTCRGATDPSPEEHPAQGQVVAVFTPSQRPTAVPKVPRGLAQILPAHHHWHSNTPLSGPLAPRLRTVLFLEWGFVCVDMTPEAALAQPSTHDGRMVL
ncbi:hypothetical protein VTI28DRAFT_8008 [Corynascus sepedonium]